MKYCQHCGHFLQEEHTGLSWLCPNCKRHTYENPVMGVDAVFFDEDGRLLLGRRARDPHKGLLNLPGGFLDPHETLEDGVMREVREELCIEPNAYGELQYAGSRIDVYEFEDHSRQIVVAAFVASLPHCDVACDDEATEYVWRLPHELTADDVTSRSEYDLIQRASRVYAALGDH